jgi:hypothetical protein
LIFYVESLGKPQIMHESQVKAHIEGKTEKKRFDAQVGVSEELKEG